MIVAKLYGGLGNQMFQYSAARGLAKPNETVYLDTKFYTENAKDTESFIARSYELHIFKNLKSSRASGLRYAIFTGKSFLIKAIRARLKPLFQHLHHQGTGYISFTEYVKSQHLYLDGYFQSEKYFSDKRQAILSEFEFPPLDEDNKLIASKMLSAENAVNFHIRRGDYLIPNINSIHGILPLSYYHKALDILKSRYGHLVVFVFSDDVPWAKKNVNTDGLEVIFIERNSAEHSWKDMALMTYCKHHIIANSSFSWWGAWLSTRRGDVFAPYNWFVPPFEFDINDIVPSQWTVLRYE
ncbi:alpha-1,2-fucosyltransferase [Mucilaginibacter psychrotolerans]|uniref:Alpha-1,2-fucosyltransferase n=1 Tax=Mucilaginibacter psychrotolerans TaxID=1524096 RepID=A0A4Y8SPN2_9SPHI|nr:alpha-1,2-fucosyltransferase [Mucilaginibacter psychrotolerans]TFF40878.1 alpha-1,2-fucosyltransferase [Mucilaginibacter psychrotolerans]